MKFNPNAVLDIAPPLSEKHNKEATGKQTALLRKLGYTGSASALTIDQASDLIEQLKRQLDHAKERILQSANLIDIAGQRVELHKESPKEYAGPCPKCGGNDRFHVRREWFFCRKCHPEKGDYIEYIRWLDNVDYYEAIRRIAGGPLVAEPPQEKVKPVSKPSVVEFDKAAWAKIVVESHNRLITGKAPRSLAYLESRGIDGVTINAFKVGAGAASLPGTEGKQRQPAILLPWYNQVGDVVAVKFRFLESHAYTDSSGKERTENKTSRGQAAGNMFGWNAVKGPQHCAVLIITEGEINGLSLWQAGQGRIDVLSSGSESMLQRLPDNVVSFAKQYQHRIIWADKGNISLSAAQAIGAASMRSPGGKDANDLLKEGVLSDLLSAMLVKLGVAIQAPIEQTPTEQPVIIDQVQGVMPSDRTFATFAEAESHWNAIKDKITPGLWVTDEVAAPGLWRDEATGLFVVRDEMLTDAQLVEMGI